MNKFYKKVVLCICLGVIMVGCAPKKDIKTVSSMSCSIKDYPISSVWKFDMNSNNQILQASLTTDITYKKLEKAYPKATKDELIQVYVEQKDKQGSDYNYITSTYPQAKKWFVGNFAYDDPNMNISSEYLFNLVHERFNYSLENNLLNSFGLVSLYNEEKKGFFYNKNVIQQSLFVSNENMVCKESNEHF